LAASGPTDLILFVDADGTVVPQGATNDEYGSAVTAARRRLSDLSNVERVQVISNGPDRGDPDTLHRINKPWTSRRRLGVSRRDRARTWVVGDQVLSDGLLAWRVGARFIEMVIDPDKDPPAQAAMRRRGERLRPLILRSD
jgi:hypothetical protein